MPFIFGTVANALEMADLLSELAIGTSLHDITAIADPGSGYAVGDELTLSGGTFTIAAMAQVTSVGGGGEVTGIRIRNAGLYQTAPSNDVATTGGGGSGCELTCDFDSNGWTRRRADNVTGAAQSATVAAGGTGYVQGDTITLSGGTFTIPAQFTVTSVGGGGEVTAVAVTEAGAYTANPTDPVSTTGGTGTGCTLNVTFGGSGERAVWLEGDGAGADEIFVGYRTYLQSGGTRAFELVGASGYDAGLTWHEQPGISRNLQSVGTSLNSCIVPLSNVSISFWLNINSRRIVGALKTGTYYGSLYLGFLNPFATGGEWPYPIYIAGTTDAINLAFNSSNINLSGITEPINTSVNEDQNAKGPAQIRAPDGLWYNVVASTFVSGTRSASSFSHRMYPHSRLTSVTPVSPDNWFSTTGRSWELFIPIFGVPGSRSWRFVPTHNPGGDPIYMLVPCSISRDIGGEIGLYYGELDSVFWVDANNALVPENRLELDGDWYTVFQCGNRTENWAFWALRED